MKKLEGLLLIYTGLLSFFSFYPDLLFSQATHPKIVLKGFDGKQLAIDSKAPYSPKKTCGPCHDYGQITNGYHFQQGRTDGSGRIVLSDMFDPKSPWSLSSGMYGKHWIASDDSSQLAKKVNRHPSEIDKSSFFIVQNCGACHPGGGYGEYDRKGNLYFNEETKKFGYQLSGNDPRLDGDYTSFSVGDPSYGAPWAQSGVSEADCLICHLKGYQWKDRAAALKGRFFRYGPAVGAGWATVRLSEEESKNQKADDLIVDYSKKEIADFESLHLQITKETPDENCWFCHAVSEGWKKGGQWSPDTDIHKAKEILCISCHSGDKNHNFAKGDTIQETVRDDLRNTMHSCEDCHYKGKDKRAPRFRHPFSPRHMKRIACQTCHIPYRAVPADLVYDHASTGETIIYDTSRFLSNDPLEPNKSTPGADPNLWFPSLREFKGRIVPVKSLIPIYWGDLDETTNRISPIFLWKIRELKKPTLKDDNSDGIQEINSPDEIKLFLKALKEKDRFGSPVANHPVLVKGEFIYRLGNKDQVEKTRHEQAQNLDFSLSHNLLSGPNVIGARGCQDCHSRRSPFFLRKVLVDPYDEKGKPVYIEAWERLGIDKEKLSRVLMEQ